LKPKETLFTMKVSDFKENLSTEDIDRIIEMAWEDRTPFEMIFQQFSINEKQLIMLMKDQMKLSSWKNWRERVQGRTTKHSKLRENSVDRFKCSRQKTINMNKISKKKYS
jgi:uncharacterized protein (TIGR03643 family)